MKKISLRDSDQEFIINEIGGSKVNIHIDYTDGGVLRTKLYKPGSETRNLELTQQLWTSKWKIFCCEIMKMI